MSISHGRDGVERSSEELYRGAMDVQKEQVFREGKAFYAEGTACTKVQRYRTNKWLWLKRDTSKKKKNQTMGI